METNAHEIAGVAATTREVYERQSRNAAQADLATTLDCAIREGVVHHLMCLTARSTTVERADGSMGFTLDNPVQRASDFSFTQYIFQKALLGYEKGTERLIEEATA